MANIVSQNMGAILSANAHAGQQDARAFPGFHKALLKGLDEAGGVIGKDKSVGIGMPSGVAEIFNPISPNASGIIGKMFEAFKGEKITIGSSNVATGTHYNVAGHALAESGGERFALGKASGSIISGAGAGGGGHHGEAANHHPSGPTAVGHQSTNSTGHIPEAHSTTSSASSGGSTSSSGGSTGETGSNHAMAFPAGYARLGASNNAFITQSVGGHGKMVGGMPSVGPDAPGIGGGRSTGGPGL